MAWREAARNLVVDLARVGVVVVADLARRFDSHTYSEPSLTACTSKAALVEQELHSCRNKSLSLANCPAELAWTRERCGGDWFRDTLLFLCGNLLGFILGAIGFWWFHRIFVPQGVVGQPVEIVVQKNRQASEEVELSSSDGLTPKRVVAARSRARALQG